MSIQAKSAKMRQPLFSFAFDKVLFTIASPIPIWYNLFALTFRQRMVSDKLSRCVNCPSQYLSPFQLQDFGTILSMHHHWYDAQRLSLPRYWHSVVVHLKLLFEYLPFLQNQGKFYQVWGLLLQTALIFVVKNLARYKTEEL